MLTPYLGLFTEVFYSCHHPRFKKILLLSPCWQAVCEQAPQAGAVLGDTQISTVIWGGCAVTQLLLVLSRRKIRGSFCGWTVAQVPPHTQGHIWTLSLSPQRGLGFPPAPQIKHGQAEVKPGRIHILGSEQLLFTHKEECDGTRMSPLP